VVNKGDTLYYIAYITDKEVNTLIALNGMSPPYTIKPGQKIKLWSSSYNPVPYAGTGSGDSAARIAAATPKKESQSKQAASSTTTATAGAATASSTDSSANSLPPNTTTKVEQATAESSTQTVAQQSTKEYVENQNLNNSAKSTSSSNSNVTSWKWPTKGRVVDKFSSGDQGNKGIDIAGSRGQSVVSTADGSIVYSGSALRGYGNLVIVKHNDKYLSAYAHNDKLLVQEGQSVKAGQKIATMGSSGRTDVRLHFEIRYQGKSVDPMRYLP
jgi:lipoprotein NlpD